MVDSIFAVRSYVLSNVCVRILKSIGTKQSGTTYLEEEESITLNWIAHCMIQGSNDNELEVRKSALQICRILVEYSALGSEMNTPENQSLIKELYSYVPDTTPPVTTFPSDSTGGSDSIIIPNVADVHIMFCRALPIISRLVEDKEYQIRSYVGTYCGEFCVLMGGKWSMILLDVIFTCCRDPIMEVRVAGLTSIPHIILAFLQDCIIKQQQLQQQQTSNSSVDEVVYRPLLSIITAVCSMSRDTNQQVKQTLCQILSKLLTLFYSISTNNHTVATTTTTTPSSNILSSIIILENIQSNLSTTMMQLLTDTSPDSKILIEIMIQFSNTLQYEEQSGNTSYLTRIFILENIKILLNSLQILSMNSLWRIRQLICSILPKLIPLICNMENKMIILNIFLKLISDPVFDVRRIACKSLCLCATTSTSSTSVTTPILTSTSSSSSSSSTSNGIFTINWLDEIILPQLETLRTSTIYSNRILALHMISTLLLEDIIHEEDIRCNILINIALTLSNDRVANVRIALCEILYHITPLFEHQQTISSIRIVSPHDDTHDPTSRQPMNINKFYKLDHQLIQLIIQTLEKMVQDRDRDVRYFATKALQNFKKDEER